jgi:hypothetical protein
MSAPGIDALLSEEGRPDASIANRVQAWTVGARRALEAGWDGRLTPAGATR